MNPGEWFQPAQRKQFDAWPEQRPDEPQQPDEPPQQPQFQRTHDQVDKVFFILRLDLCKNKKQSLEY